MIMIIDLLGNRRGAVLRRIFCAGKSVSNAALLGVMQGRDTNPDAEKTSKTVLRKFPGKSNIKKNTHSVLAIKPDSAAKLTAVCPASCIQQSHIPLCCLPFITHTANIPLKAIPHRRPTFGIYRCHPTLHHALCTFSFHC